MGIEHETPPILIPANSVIASDSFLRPIIRCFKLNPNAELPSYGSEKSACFDIRACFSLGDVIKTYTTVEEKAGIEHGDQKVILHRGVPFNFIVGQDGKFILSSGDRALIPTGLIFDIPDGYSLRLHPRSGLSWKNGITLLNAEGVVDEDYIEQTFVILYNASPVPYTINHGDRICQGELQKNLFSSIVEVKEKPLPKTSRAGGFGSTGK